MTSSRMCRLSVTEQSVLCPWSSVRSCCRSVSSLWRTLLSSWWKGMVVALALILARLLLRGGCPSVPHLLPPVLRGGCAGPGFPGPARLDISLLTAWRLALGPCFLVGSPAIRCHPMGCHSWWFAYVSTIWNVSIFFPGNMGLHFFRINRSFLGNVWFFLFLELLASPCPGSYGREGGSAGLCLHPPASMAPDPRRLSG